MSRNAEVTQPDGSVRARILQGTQQAVGPLLVGVMGAHAAAGGQSAHARLEVLVHRSLDVATPGVVRLQEGESIALDGIGNLMLAAVAPPSPQQGPPPSSGRRAVVFLELRTA